MKWLAVRFIRVYCCFRSKGHDAMNQSRNRSKARAIAIAKADESNARKSLLIRAAAIAVCALAAIAALPSFWSF
ncbi:hypothetical protein OE766_10595 [Pararhizobium sp. YC-54]|uniref:hypothetical protein n=1 Tax=Pararhizobium sp. YC-54 TaxID=2986920 RepID=UPI0021F7FF05|nr:hypothetical protein [Pararhizobium sp. YC-54]MCV9998696.1 hypothetical protein [Pararhizobium sp. YC-54]